ncbi:MAG: OadG family protein [Proteobacteria bacterium]|nr:OadG family protein [Pseudomonadota bacterium]MBU4297872.1 OadG family protein [Pseudomonadota bacterium]MCG2750109.1 OadG family protein [Desulfobulbaceae bacterium]
MNFSFDHMGVANLFAGDFNAVTFSIIGMLLVFVGLTIISLYIVCLPWLLKRLGKRQARPTEAVDKVAEQQNIDQEKEILMAIATAFYLDQNFPEENQKITWKSHGDVESPWLISGRVQGMAQRTHVTRRVFPHR